MQREEDRLKWWRYTLRPGVETHSEPFSSQFLLALGVDPFLEGRSGRVLNVAKAEDIIRTLRRHSAKIEAEEGYYRTFNTDEDERPLPPSPSASQEVKTRKAVHSGN